MIINADCKEAIKKLIDEGVQVDAIVTDPPYEISFMCSKWDSTGIAYDIELWKLCLQVLKPGGHLLSFGGARTYHRMACAIEDAGFEIRDQIMWVYGSGFPKSLNISKAIDRMAGAEREVIGKSEYSSNRVKDIGYHGGYAEPERLVTAPATDAAKQWDGWGTALKPAHESIVLARRPLSEKTIAENVLKHGTGGLNIDACRVGVGTGETKSVKYPNIKGDNYNQGHQEYKEAEPVEYIVTDKGRFPANLIHDGSEEVEEEFAKYGERKSGAKNPHRQKNRDSYNGNMPEFRSYYAEASTGTASRFFYSAKASKRERRGSKHPTVKPLALMRYLCRLVTPPGGTVLDPFAGTGTTGEAAKLEGFNYILIEKEAQYIADIEKRLRE